MKSKILTTFVSFTAIAVLAPSLLLNTTNAAGNQVKPSKVINGVIINESTLVPLRDIFENLGATIKWDEATKKITATKDAKTIVLTVGDAKAYVNDQLNTLSVVPQIINEKTMIPARFVSESLGAKVEWDSVNSVVKIDEHIKVVFTPDVQTIGKLLDTADEFYFKVGAEDGQSIPIDFSKDNTEIIANAFKARIPQLAQYFTSNFINTVLLPNYRKFFYPTSLNLIPSGELLEIRSNVIQENENLIRVQGISLEDDISGAYNFEIKLVKQDNRWLIDSLTGNSQNINFNITEVEAAKYIDNYFHEKDSKITFKGKIKMNTQTNSLGLSGDYYQFNVKKSRIENDNTITNEVFDALLSVKTGYILRLP
ncbi:copper amine oxidase N-terminal domain-containing protein [Paenibacillus sp. FSL H7-0331]|uniref:copper amine oxidase N-terminal domain-containing protein n=1 Tax=Paenibacillus sp. FSL H7-0331 TaxID=1920421 RepID=UPI00096F92A4|nr:copper amine oxidase N-terminal domain-containing protein [Paenibacillus sp. FSL H7-0331]OME97906.1 hypothetical protein BK127_40010 [Paenibacillus sp. FSL H7-0331]